MKFFLLTASMLASITIHAAEPMVLAKQSDELKSLTGSVTKRGVES